MTENKKNPLVPILSIVIVLLLAIIGYLLFQTNEKTEIIVKQENKIEADSATIKEKVKELEELSLALTRAKMEIDELGTSNDTLNEQLAQLNDYIKQVKAGNAKQISSLSSKLNEYKKILETKDKEINTLRLVADSLTTTVGNLTLEKSKMNDSIATLQSAKTELAKQVAIASILKAENLKVIAITRKDKELEKEEYKVKDIAKLKINFYLGDNKVARKDTKQIIMRLIEPNGSVLYDAATGGGFFNVDGKDLPYTDKRSVKFENSRQQVGFVYVKGGEFKTGKHKIELYGDGFKIGETSFTVK